jgi:hypothetical protein
MGESFHWMDQGRTLEALYHLVSTDGGVAILSRGVPLPLPPMTAWRLATCRVVRQYLGEIPLPWDHEPSPPEELHEAYLKRSRFKDVIEHDELFEVEWTVESIIGNLYSTSFCNRKRLGDRAQPFVTYERNLGGRALRDLSWRTTAVRSADGVQAMKPMPGMPARYGEGPGPQLFELNSLARVSWRERLRSSKASSLSRMIESRNATWSGARSNIERELHRGAELLRGHLEQRSSVLDVGCGAGIPLTRMLAETFDVTGVDISTRQIELARRNVPNARFITACQRRSNVDPLLH